MITADAVTKRGCWRLRVRVSEIFGFDAPERLILTPGSLLTLRLVFASLGVQSVELREEEYYSQSHFPDLSAAGASRAKESGRINTAVIESLVTWKGQAAENVFAGSRKAERLRVLDASHAGAVGFPKLDRPGVDLIFGNPGHWLGMGAAKENLGLMFVANEALWLRLATAFGMFYLAVEGSAPPHQSRWVDPGLLNRVSSWLERHRIDRNRALRQHDANLRLAGKVAEALGLPAPATALLWSPKKLRGRVLKPLRDAGLVWNPKIGGTRIMCRADMLKFHASL